MSYLAIARKYRPATFDEIVGQQHVTRTLRNAIERDRIHHAYLFCGARGVGKTTAARALAKALNCAEGPTATPCGVCTSCTEVAHGASPDLIEIDGASNNSVENVRELRETVRYAPAGGKWKVYLVDEVHMLSTAAFNALLKTLEEPPPHVLFVFATTEPQKIPDTILSRVQRFDFKRIPMGAVVQRLAEISEAEGASISEASLRRIATAGEGSMRDAQSLLDKVISFAGPSVSDDEVSDILGLIDRGLLHGALTGLLLGKPDEALKVVAAVHEYGYELSQFVAELLQLVRDVTLLRLSPAAREHVELPQDEIDTLDALSKDVAPDTLTRLFSTLVDLADQVSRAARPRLHVEMAIARLATVRPALPLPELVVRLESLDRRLRAGGAVAARPGAGRPARGPRARVRPTAKTAPRRAKAPSSGNGRPATASKAAAPSLPPTATPQMRLDALRKGLAGLGDAVAPITSVQTVRFHAQKLVFTAPGGRAASEARRVLERADVAGLIAQCYPAGTTATVEASLAPRNDTAMVDLEAEVLAHPATQAILNTLRAELKHVAPDAPSGDLS